MNIKIIFLMLSIINHQTIGLYIKSSGEKHNKDVLLNHLDDWGVFQSILGLSKQKVELLKAQKDQDGTKKLLNLFIKENPKYLATSATLKKTIDKHFMKLYQTILNRLLKSKRMLKTSLNVELSEIPPMGLRRTRRKIAIKMVSDISLDRIDKMLKFYQKQHGSRINNDNDDNSDIHDDATYYNYNDMDNTSRSSMETNLDSDYTYDNLYDDEGDMDLSAKSRQNSEYGSFQDLILQAKMNQLDLESEETKLHPRINDHFV